MVLDFWYKKWYKKFAFCLSMSLGISLPILEASSAKVSNVKASRAHVNSTQINSLQGSIGQRKHARFFLTKEPITNKNTVFLWDIHKVLVGRSSFVEELRKRKNRWAIFKKTKHTSAYVWKALCMKLFSHKSGEAYARLAIKHENKELAELIKSVFATIEKPMTFTVNILQELKRRGYTHYIGSNIGPEFFIDLQKRMSDIFNDDLFNLTGSQFAVYDNGRELCKPSILFFQEFIDKNNIDLTKTHVIFIDDKEENVKAARKIGFIGIHYKNHMQLRQELRKLQSNLVYA